MENKYQLYNGIWYRYSPDKYGVMDVWELSEKEDDAISELKMFFNANQLRIDQCLSIFQEEWLKDEPNRNYGKPRK